MTSEISAIAVAVCGTFLVCLLLFKQHQKPPAKNRRWSSDRSGSDGGSYLGDSGNHFGGIDVNYLHSASHSHADGHGSDHSGSSHAGDSGSSGDSGGGDGGGGGGSD